jgi:hypothetical protein
MHHTSPLRQTVAGLIAAGAGGLVSQHAQSSVREHKCATKSGESLIPELGKLRLS